MNSTAPLFQRIAPDVKLGRRVKIFAFTNLYGCEIGDDVKIGAFVEIQKGARIGNRCKISSHSFICEGVTLEEEVFIVLEVLPLKKSYVYYLTHTRQIPVTRIGRRLLFDYDRIVEWREERTVDDGADVPSQKGKRPVVREVSKA